MRLVDVDKLPISKVGKISIVLWEDIMNAKTYYPKVKKVAPAGMIDIKWLQDRMTAGIGENIYSDEHLDTKYFAIINGYLDEYKREVQNADK